MAEKKILVLNGRSYSFAVDSIAEVYYSSVDFLNAPESTGMILFTGGADVSPNLYGDASPKKLCYNNPMRDYQEAEIYKQAKRRGILTAGICRGLQFLNVMAGGKMIHHVKNHSGGTHNVVTSLGENMVVNSLHHQAILPPTDSIVTMTTEERLSDEYVGKNDEIFPYKGPEIEAAIFPNHGSLGVQYHPEMMSTTSDGYVYFWQMINSALKLPWPEFLKKYGEMQNVGKKEDSNNSCNAAGQKSVVVQKG